MTSEWTTTPEADFINSLCPVIQPPVPGWFRRSHLDERKVKEALTEGFNNVRHKWFHRLSAAPRELTRAEEKIWLAVSLKTIRFGKLCEKVPRRVLRDGQLDHDNFGLPILPATGLDDSGVSKGVRGLLEKGWLWKFESTPHPKFGASSVYCPMDLQCSVEEIFYIVRGSLFSLNDLRTRDYDEFFWSSVEPLLKRPPPSA